MARATAQRDGKLDVCALAIAMGGILLIAGCHSPGAGPATRASKPLAQAPITNTDACASRLHDLCGALLLFYLDNDRLPDALGDLKQLPGGDDAGPMICPVSKLPYRYTPDGIRLIEQHARVIVYDAAPSHSGMRWAIEIREPVPGQPLVTNVVALPESFFLLHPEGK